MAPTAFLPQARQSVNEYLRHRTEAWRQSGKVRCHACLPRACRSRGPDQAPADNEGRKDGWIEFGDGGWASRHLDSPAVVPIAGIRSGTSTAPRERPCIFHARPAHRPVEHRRPCFESTPAWPVDYLHPVGRSGDTVELPRRRRRALVSSHLTASVSATTTTRTPDKGRRRVNRASRHDPIIPRTRAASWALLFAFLLRHRRPATSSRSRCKPFTFEAYTLLGPCHLQPSPAAATTSTTSAITPEKVD